MLIRGPVSLSIVDFRGRLFYLFGDHHFSMDSECPEEESTTINEVLDIWLNLNDQNKISTNVFVEENIYLESKRQERFTEDYLQSIRVQLEDCLRERSSCRYEHIRFHSTDVRTTVIGGVPTHTSMFIVPVIYYANALEKLNLLNSVITSGSQSYRGEVIKLIDTLLDMFVLVRHIMLNVEYYFSIETTSNNYIKDVNNYPILRSSIRSFGRVTSIPKIGNTIIKAIGDELGNDINNMTLGGVTDVDTGHNYNRIGYELSLLDPDLKEEILDYTRKKLIKLKIDFELFMNNVTEGQEYTFVERLKMLNNSRNENDLGKLFSELVGMYSSFENSEVLYSGAYVMDCYVISRMLRFESEEIISYSGDAHNRNYVEFFTERLNGGVIEKADELGTRCISSEFIPQKLNIY